MQPVIDQPINNTRARILISACLMGEAVRYDGKDKRLEHPRLTQWQREKRIVPICPECAGGLATPRNPAEIMGHDPQSASGLMVLHHNAQVIDTEGNDLSNAFVAGARHALALAKKWHIKLAVLKENSPSCGSQRIYDGSFSGQTRAGSGVTAALLVSAGLHVFNEHQLEEAHAALMRLDHLGQACAPSPHKQHG